MADKDENQERERRRDDREFKPLPLLAAWLAQEHAERQEAIGDQVAAGLALLWPIMRFDDLDGATPAWLHATTLEIEKGWNESVQAAYEFVQESWWAVEPDAPELPEADVEFPARAVQVGMRVQGPLEVKRKVAQAVPEDAALQAGERASTGVGVTRALDGGRAEVVAQVVAQGRRNAAADAVRDRQWAVLQAHRAELAELEASGRGEMGRARRLRELISDIERSLDGYVPSDPEAVGAGDPGGPVPSRGGGRRVESGTGRPGGVVGFARVTDSNPCYFCALLASQGAVYYSGESFSETNSKVREVKWTSAGDKGAKRAFLGDGIAKVHDHCRCTLRPVFRAEDSRDERAEYFLAQWEKHSAGRSGHDAMLNYRRNYVPPPPNSADALDSAEAKRLLADVRHNRELLLARGFEATSPNVRFFDKTINKLEKF